MDASCMINRKCKECGAINDYTSHFICNRCYGQTTLITQSIEFMSRFAAQQNLAASADHVLISINDSEKEMYDSLLVFSDKKFLSGEDLLLLVFSDNNVGQKGFIDKEQARKIVEFIDENKNKSFYIHCFFGVSRSGAVAKFINEYLELGDNFLERYDNYNKDVYNVLWSIVRPSLREMYEQDGLVED